ncbi:MAG: YitT family protein [Lachnospiraceae bacterium]|nr:YitT family protein [Lachnospiraceae bacterium]MCR5477508.1 YitT family protein [Lachnospiraceae bacterium]
MDKKTLRSDARRILLCTIAGLIIAVNLRTFIHTGELIPAGFSGVTLLLQTVFRTFFHIELPYSPVYILMNLFPIIISFRKIGKKYTIYSCVVIILGSILTDLLPAYIITYDILLISVFGGLVNGFAIALCLYAGATSGGTDFIAIYFSEHHNVDAWDYVMYFNALVLLIDGALFGWDKALYSIIFQFVSTQVIKAMYKHYQKHTLFVVTDKPAQIAALINRETMHGSTEIDVKGTYQGTPRQMIYSVIDTDELKHVVRQIREADPEAFVNVVKTDSLAGKFHMRPKD